MRLRYLAGARLAGGPVSRELVRDIITIVAVTIVILGLWAIARGMNG
jgi:hypothetical protein